MKRMWSKEELQTISQDESKKVIESGAVDNAKPIYYHPIYMSDNSANFRIQLAIIDNKQEAYTKDTLFDKIYALLNSGAIINCNGVYRPSSESNYGGVYMMYGAGHNLYYYHETNLPNSIPLDSIKANIDTFIDGVNKIN